MKKWIAALLGIFLFLGTAPAYAADAKVTFSIDRSTLINISYYSDVTLETIRIAEDPSDRNELRDGDIIRIELPDNVTWVEKETEVWVENLDNGERSMYSRSSQISYPDRNTLKIKFSNINANVNSICIKPVINYQGFQGDAIYATLSGISIGNSNSLLIAETRSRGEGAVTVYSQGDIPIVIPGKKSQQLASIYLEEDTGGILTEDDTIVVRLIGGATYNITESSNQPVRSALQGGDRILSGFQITSSTSAEMTTITTSYNPTAVLISLTNIDIAADAAAEIKAQVSIGKKMYELVVATVVLPEDKKPSVFMIGANQYMLHGQQQSMEVVPYIKNGRTYLPLRYVAYALGITDQNINWNPINQQITLRNSDMTITMQIGKTTILAGQYYQESDAAPELFEGRAMLPARAVVEAFGGTITWNAVQQSTTITPKL